MTQAPHQARPTAAETAAPDRLLTGLGARLWLARYALFWERLWPSLWPAAGVLGGFLILALFDLLPDLPVWLHSIVLGLFLAALGYALWRGLRGISFPGFDPARRRIEQQSALSHRPLNALRDQLAAGVDDPASRALWELHQRRMRDSLNALKVGVPTPGLARRDPFAIRAGLLPRHQFHRRQDGVQRAIQVGAENRAGLLGCFRHAGAVTGRDAGIGNHQVERPRLADPRGHRRCVPDVDDAG